MNITLCQKSMFQLEGFLVVHSHALDLHMLNKEHDLEGSRAS